MGWHGLTKRESDFPGTLPELIAQGADLLRRGKALLPMQAIDLNSVRILPPVPKPPKILCVGLNYDDHLVSAHQELAMHPKTALDQAYHFGMFMMKAVLDGRASQLIDLARVNLTR